MPMLQSTAPSVPGYKEVTEHFAPVALRNSVELKERFFYLYRYRTSGLAFDLHGDRQRTGSI